MDDVSLVLQEGANQSDNLAWIPGVLALMMSVFTLWWNYSQAERRRSADILRHALIDLSTGPVADARDTFAEMMSEPDNREFSEFRKTYFVLCWSLQRAKSALDESVKRKESHGREELWYHFDQIALMVLSVHTVLHESFHQSLEELFDDAHIWKLIGAEVEAVAPSGWKPDNSGKLLHYFYKEASGSDLV